jgi:dienelactone hydrolase
MRKLIAILLLGFFALLVVPVLLARFSESERRSFEWVRLGDTEFEEISFRNTEQDLQLGGMLFVPEGDGPFPGAIIIQGSGTSRRDNGWYLTLVHYLQENGVVVLLPDKRGSERSEGNWRAASFEDLATDTEAAIAFLRDQDEIGISHIGIIGLSQGGHIAPIVANQTQDITFLVNVVGAAIPMHELLVYEEMHNLREFGVLAGLSDLLAYPAAWSVKIRQREFWNAVGNFDPRPYWQELSVPSLVLYGENDTNVPSIRSAEVLRSLGNQNIDVRIYGGSGHALESPEGKGNSIFREDALRDIRDFIVSESVADTFRQ